MDSPVGPCLYRTEGQQKQSLCRASHKARVAQEKLEQPLEELEQEEQQELLKR